MQAQVKTKKKTNFFKRNKDHLINYAAFILGIVTLCFTRFTYNMFFCAILFPIFLTFFNRREKHWYITLPLLLVGCFAGCFVSCFGIMKPFGLWKQFKMTIVTTAFVYIPFILDKMIFNWFFSKRPMVQSTLFALSWCVLDWISSYTTSGTYYSISCALSQVMPITSIASLFGLFFITFMITFFSSAFVQFTMLPKKRMTKELTIACSLMGFSVLYSGVYNATAMTGQSNAISVMSAHSTNDYFPGSEGSRTKLSVKDQVDWLVEDINRASAAQVDILVYPEEAFWLYNTAAVGEETEQQIFQTRMSKMSVQAKTWIVAGVCVQNNPDYYIEGSQIRNVAWIANPITGEIQEYVKTIAFKTEEQGIEVGDGSIATFDVAGKGKVGVAICMDMNFHRFISKYGRAGCDLVIAPAWDWPQIPPNHSHTVAFRAVENGFNFLRSTACGWSLGVDYTGRTVEQFYVEPVNLTNPTEEEKAGWHQNHVSSMPCNGRKTLYCYLAPGLDYVYPVAFVALLTVYAVLEGKKRQAAKKGARK